ncbi:AsmA-like C-terminal region-containing protein [Flavobacterium rhizosphaerae]|uniref:AsmA-like C-terminal region-containing protein n=1 Tax=Flavobacterium rhizosphaerae TaxID=3163298 RepID=A0ABW8YWW4_9FLAO
MVKKILKWTGIVLLVLVLLLAAAPFLFKNKIKSMVLKAINEQVDANVAFEDVSLSLFSHFPKASVTVDKLSIINKAPFEGDTLVYMGEINLNMSVIELFNDAGEPINLESFSTKDGIVNILFNKDGVGNFDIAVKNAEETPADTTASKPFALNVHDYNVENLRFRYYDEGSKMNLVIDSLYHKGFGNFEQSKLDLDTETTAKLTFDMDKTNYMRDVRLKLDAVLGIDLENSVYTFKENKALINQLPLEFDGSVALVEQGQQIDLTFKTPTSSFKNFLGLVPEAYSGSLASVQTTGDFTINGKVNGLNGDNSVPKFNVAMASDNASFKYPDLPKSVQDITIDCIIINETGILNDTYVDLNKLAFRIDQDVFTASAHIRNVMDNPLVDAALKGTINLANFSKAYPVKLDIPLSGMLKADVDTQFDMASVEAGTYEKIKNSGSLNLTGFTYNVEGFKSPFVINEADMQFNPSRVTLNRFNAKTGKSDLSVNGTLDNFYGFLFKDQTLKGNFALSSDKLVVSDFMAEETKTTTTVVKEEEKDEKTTTTKTTTTSGDAVKIPAFLDCTITAKANSVVYDNLNLSNVSGKMVIRDETVSLKDLVTTIFGGQIGLNGDVSTKGAKPTFDMALALKSLDITQSFTQLDMLKKIAPIAQVITGKLNTNIAVKGFLESKEMTPDLNTLTGSLGGELASAALNPEKSKLLSALNNNVKFINLDNLNLNNQKINLTFDDGKVNIKPFDLKYQDIKIQIAGQHGFDQSMNYNVTFDVPAKYLGSDVTKLLAKYGNVDASKMMVPVTALLTGTFDNPKVSTDLSKSVTNLTNQLKDKLVEEAKTKGTEALTNFIKGQTNSTDTTKTKVPVTKEEAQEQVKEKAEEAVKKGLQNLLNKNKKQ